MTADLFSKAVFLVLGPDRIAACSYTTSSRWTAGMAAFRAARAEGKELPIIFGDAQNDSGRLYRWAVVEEISLGAKGTTVRFAGVRDLEAGVSSDLIKESDGRPMSRAVRRGHSVVFTPPFLSGPNHGKWDSRPVQARRWSRTLSPEQYVHGFRAIETRVSPLQRRMMAFQYFAPDRRTSAREIAAALGVQGGYSVVNAQYGRLARTFSDATGISPDSRKDGSQRLWSIFSIGYPLDGRGFVWELLPAVATALETLGWVRDEVASEVIGSGMPPIAARSFDHETAFLAIARVINLAAGRTGSFVGHREIVASLLADPVGNAIVEKACMNAAWPDSLAAASNIVAWFSQRVSVGLSRWGELFERTKQDGVWAYRPKTLDVEGLLAETDYSAIEGEPRMYFHMRRERDRKLAAEKRRLVRATAGHVQCEVCGLRPDEAYPGLVDSICEVHHRRPLSHSVHAVETELSDLAVVCANCHRAIHQTNPMMSVEDFRDRFFGRRG